MKGCRRSELAHHDSFENLLKLTASSFILATKINLRELYHEVLTINSITRIREKMRSDWINFYEILLVAIYICIYVRLQYF